MHLVHSLSIIEASFLWQICKTQQTCYNQPVKPTFHVMIKWARSVPTQLTFQQPAVCRVLWRELPCSSQHNGQIPHEATIQQYYRPKRMHNAISQQLNSTDITRTYTCTCIWIALVLQYNRLVVYLSVLISPSLQISELFCNTFWQIFLNLEKSKHSHTKFLNLEKSKHSHTKFFVVTL